MEAKKYKCLMFDFDGTLFDTVELNYRAYKLAYFDLGVEITRDMFSKTNGLSVYSFNKVMGVECDVEKLRQLKQHYYAEISLYAKPNKYLIDIIKSTQLKKALVTTARRVNIDPLLNKWGLNFDYYITQEDVEKHKPDPECYNKVIEYFGVSADECLAFEDSRSGFTSARSAGLDCIRIDGFYDDCIKDMSGGSGCKTKLILEKDSLWVYKRAENFEYAERLTCQYKKLMSEMSDDLFVDAEPTCIKDGVHGKIVVEYRMPYVFAPNLYQYINKTSAISNLMFNLFSYSCVGKYEEERRVNRSDWRKKFFFMYIAPGVEIYKNVTGNDLDLPIKRFIDIPEIVNDFRITRYHGDTTFENTLVLRDGKILLIDPVPDNNTVTGIAHDMSKIGQSLMGYEAIRDGEDYDYTIERGLFDELCRSFLTKEEYCSLKFYTACLFLRRLKHQQHQDPKLVSVYGDIAKNLMWEFIDEDFSWNV